VCGLWERAFFCGDGVIVGKICNARGKRDKLRKDFEIAVSCGGHKTALKG